jgi:hypothetical protein
VELCDRKGVADTPSLVRYQANEDEAEIATDPSKSTYKLVGCSRGQEGEPQWKGV